MRERRRRLVITFALIWAVLSGVGVALLNIFAMPPSTDVSDQAQGQSQLIKLLSELAWPIMVLVLLTLLFTVFVNRLPGAQIERSPAELRGNVRIQTVWIGLSLAIVLALATLGTVSLANDSRVGTPDPVTHAAPLEVQVIGQQWLFTYRYPSQPACPNCNGMETSQLVVPAKTEVEFHVTSLDVVHSWWFYAAGIKADANPGVDNEIEAEFNQTGTYRISCSELCGIWHSGMQSEQGARVVSQSEFQSWAQQQLQADAPVMQYLPKLTVDGPWIYAGCNDQPQPADTCPQPGSYGS